MASSNQIFDVNIKNIYASYIKPDKPSNNKQDNRGIDDYRSSISIKGITPKMLSNAINKNEQYILLKPESSYQESRCHAFYRMIGFPVFDFKSENFYNPGVDNNFTNPNNQERKISKEDKRKIAFNCINNKELIKLYDERENIPFSFLKEFNANNSLNASILSLSSLNKRDFAAPLKNIVDPQSVTSNLEPLKASYYIDMNGHVGKHRPSLYEYIGVDGNTPTLSSSFSTRKHIIYPFLTDPRITETVNLKNSLSAPFAISNLLTNQDNKVSETQVVTCPMLETIITNRVSLKEAETGYLKEIKDFVKNVPEISYKDLVVNFLSENSSTEQIQFQQYISIMQSMITKLVEAQLIIEDVQELYYWLPIPSSSGPEYGVSIRPIIMTSSIANNQNFITKDDYDIINSSIDKMINETAASKQYIQKKSIFPQAAIIFNPEVNDDCGNNPAQNLKLLNNKRNNKLKTAGESLQIIEMIMGEFSGLGLCDILAIVASLYIMPIKQLLGFLDADAFIRMKNYLNLPNVEQSTLLEAQAELTDTVMMFYNIMDKLYLDIRQNKGIDSNS